MLVRAHFGRTLDVPLGTLFSTLSVGKLQDPEEHCSVTVAQFTTRRNTHSGADSQTIDYPRTSME